MKPNLLISQRFKPHLENMNFRQKKKNALPHSVFDIKFIRTWTANMLFGIIDFNSFFQEISK